MMEATGVLWKPVWHILEPEWQLLLVNLQHLKRVPGRKTDVRDAEWIAQLLQCGLLRGSYVPKLSPRTFWNFAGEFSSFRRQGAVLRNKSCRDRLEPVLVWRPARTGFAATRCPAGSCWPADRDTITAGGSGFEAQGLRAGVPGCNEAPTRPGSSADAAHSAE